MVFTTAVALRMFDFHKNHIRNKKQVEWMFDEMRIEKIILAPIWATKIFRRFQLYQMLDIVPSCNFVQHQGKLMMQPSENGKNPNFGPNLGPPNFFPCFTSASTQTMFQAITKFQTDEPNLKNDKKNQFWARYCSLWPKFGPQNFFLWILPQTDVRHYCKVSLYSI